MRTFFHPSVEDLSLDNIFYALSDPIRLRIVRNLAECSESSCGSFGFEVAKSTLSHHFKVLRECGIIRSRAEGTQHIVALRLDDLEVRFPGLMRTILALPEEAHAPAAKR